MKGGLKNVDHVFSYNHNWFNILKNSFRSLLRLKKTKA